MAQQDQIPQNYDLENRQRKDFTEDMMKKEEIESGKTLINWAKR